MKKVKILKYYFVIFSEKEYINLEKLVRELNKSSDKLNQAIKENK